MLSVMILGNGISRTGIMDEFAKFITGKAGSHKRNLIGLLSISVGVLSGLIQNIGAAALFLPGILQVSRRTKIPASSLIMPIGFAEIIIPPGSELAGKSIREFSLRKRYAVEPVILFNKGERVAGNFSDVEIIPGDTLIVYGRWIELRSLKKSTDFVVLTSIEADKKDKSKTWPAVACFVFDLT
jgi:di/tricarboxylate transporter